jgi:hypothetical protein
MSDVIAPTKTVTFTITKAPRREAERKTIQRLMQMQPEARRGLKALQRKRRQTDNITYIRAGVWWTNRKRASRPFRPDVGESFTLRITPQIIPDLRSVEEYLDAKEAS